MTMKSVLQRIKGAPTRETLTEAYEVRAFRDESDVAVTGETMVPALAEVQRPESVAIQAAKDRIEGHGEQRCVPDDCQFGDNDLCNAEK
jgi:hypothetical protein